MKKVFAIIIVSAVFLSYNLYETDRKGEYPSTYLSSNASYISDERLTEKSIEVALKDEVVTNPTTTAEPNIKTPRTGDAKVFYLFFILLAISAVVLTFKNKGLFGENK